MKQFIFAKSIAASGTTYDALADYALGFSAKNYLSSGKPAIGGELKNEFNLVVKENGYLNVQPIYSNNFKYVKSVKQDPTKYTATLTIPEGQLDKGCYSIIIVKNGVPFNERNKWTVSHYAANGTYGNNVAEDLVNQINKLGFVTASVATRTITITAKEKGINYTVLAADMLSDVTVSETKATFAINDAKAIIDLYNKCAADRGMNYTYQDNGDLYPKLPFNPLQGSDAADAGFTVYTLTFAEPRNTKTTDEVINQVVHIVLPSTVTTTALDATLEAIVNGGNVENTSESPALD